jgi:membrane protein YqaA with SNARE-associated domain
MLELAGLFAASFVAATLFPLPSEAALFVYLQAHPDRAPLAVALATLGNTSGGMTTYVLGRWIPQGTTSRVNPKAIPYLKRFGAVATLFAWLPLFGDALSLAAGWLRVNWLAVLAFMAAGRLARYIAVAFLST